MMEGCQIIGFDYTYLFLNKIALIQSNITKEEIIGKTMDECYPGIENNELFSVIRRCMEKRMSEDMENEFSYPDGKKRSFKLRLEPVPEGVFILSEDITERKIAEEALLESNKRFNKLVSELNDIVWTASPDGLNI